jgi:serine/threonine protein kinase/Tfp pilus assembly protein PilF
VIEVDDRLQAALARRYRFERELGRGGMATVYLAEDVKHRRPVAVKILHPQLALHVGAERFHREVDIAARLNHPHILTLIDSGEADGYLYYVMPYVQGESLRARLARERQLPVADALAIGRQVASALGYAHAQGIVHRDIKPENVMLHEGEAMVADFGIARALSEGGDATLTQTGTAVGTPAYMSPEQASGERELDGRSDIYSLGCMLYEMLVGEPPFGGATAQAIIVKRFTEAVPSIRGLRPSVSDGVERVVLRALARAPAERYATAAEFAVALSAQGGGASTPPQASRTVPVAVTAPAAGTKSVAVLPFADMSPQKDQDYFCDGIAEEIMNALAKIQALQVASRSSAFAFKGKNQDIRQVGEQLGVSTVLEGSVRKAGNRLRITAQLVNVSDGYHLWSERYDRDLEDVFAVQDEIAENIVRALRVVLSDEEKRAIEKPRPENVRAYEYYLRGRQALHQFREKSLQLARRMFQRAIDTDAGFVLAHAGMADCSSFLYMYWDASKANLEQADASSRTALALGPDVAEAHASRGLALTLTRRYPEAEQEFETAIRIDPRLFEAHYFFARTYFQQGKQEEAAREYQLASEVRPEDFQAPCLLAVVYEALGRMDQARAAWQRTVAAVEQHLELNPDDARAYYLGAGALVSLGDRERGLAWSERALAIDPGDSGVLYNVGCAFSRLGMRDRALGCLERAVETGFGHREWIEHDLDLQPLRDDPRYQALLDRL